MLCIYHIADHDGKGSGAVVKSVYPEIELMGLNHDMEIPYEEIARHDKIVVCDFALPVDFMFELSETKDFTWIDHHASVIDKYEEELAKGRKPIKGLRKVGQAAIELSVEMEQLEASEDEVGQAVAIIARQNNMTVEQLKPYYDAEFKAAVVRSVLTSKVMKLVRDAAEIEKI